MDNSRRAQPIRHSMLIHYHYEHYLIDRNSDRLSAIDDRIVRDCIMLMNRVSHCIVYVRIQYRHRALSRRNMVQSNIL